MEENNEAEGDKVDFLEVDGGGNVGRGRGRGRGRRGGGGGGGRNYYRKDRVMRKYMVGVGGF